MPKKISVKIIISFTILILTMVFTLLVFFDDLIKDRHMEVITNEMEEKVHFIEHVLRNDLLSVDYYRLKKIDASIKRLSKIIKLRITVIDENGVVLADSHVLDPEVMDNHNYRVEIIAARKKGTGYSTRYSNTIKSSMMYYAIRSGKNVIRLAKPLNQIKKTIFQTRSIIIMSGLIVLASSIFILIIITRRIIGPINESISFAESFSAGDYSRRILNYSDDEIGNLQKALNNLADIILDKINSLILEQNKLEVTIETIDDGIALVDSERHIVISNTAFNEFVGYDGSSRNRIYYEVIRNSYLNDSIKKCLLQGKALSFKRKISNDRYCEVFINPIKDTTTQQGLLIVLHDLSESKRLEEMKTDLISNMSHEFKTPIAILKGYLETIQDNIDDKSMSMEMIDRALSNLDRQTLLVNDILKLNRLETTDDFNADTIEIKSIVQNCVDILSTKADQKGITLENKIQDVINYYGNRFLAEEIFFNLIDNGINYNRERGAVKISSHIENGFQIISIADTGIGIPESAIDRIFERFYRVDKSRSRATGGTGLGLSIVKHAAELLNWTITVESSNYGTTFYVAMPVKSDKG